MTTPVARTPDSGVLRSLVVGSAVSRSNGMRAVNDISFLTGFAGPQQIYQGHPHVDTQVPPFTYTATYVRSPGVFAVLLAFRLIGDTARASAKVAVTALSGTLGWLDQNGVDGTTALGAFNLNARSSAEGTHVAVMDVSGLTVGTPTDLEIAVSTPVDCFGIYWMRLTEVPLAALAPESDPTTENGLDGAWPAPWNRIVEGDPATQSYGVRRWVSELHKARKQFRRHLQLINPDTNFQPWQRAAAGYSNVWNATFRLRARRLYTTSDQNSYLVRPIYRTSNGTTTGNLRITQGANVSIVALPASTPRTSATAATFTIDTSTTDQEVDVTLELERASGSGTVYVPTVTIYEDEA